MELENIHELRIAHGIDDADLQQDIQQLSVGDYVAITLLTGDDGIKGECIWVQITSINGHTFRAELTNRPICFEPDAARVGMPIEFGAEHIHSIHAPVNGR